MNQKELIKNLQEAILKGDTEKCKTLTIELLEVKNPLELIQECGVAAMDEAGSLFQSGSIFLPELIMASEAMQAAMDYILPEIKTEETVGERGEKVVLGTVTGDIHDIGKNIVKTVLSVSGFEVFDIGVDIAPKSFISKADEVGARYIAASALLTTSMPYQRDIVKYLEDQGLRENYYVLVGGGCTTPEWAQEIGADGWCKTAGGLPDLFARLRSIEQQAPLSKPIIFDY